MSKVIFALGPNDSYFFENPTHWEMHNLPESLRAHFQPCHVAYAYQVVLGANNSFFMAYRDKNGFDSFRSQGLPESLRNWLMATNEAGHSKRHYADLRIALGPNNESYWASDGHSSLWLNLPDRLNDAINKLRNPSGGWTSAPRLVALGANNNYIMITAQNGSSWDVSAYPELDRRVNQYVAAAKGQGGALRPIQYVSLDQYSLAFVLMSTQNEIWARVPEGRARDSASKIVDSMPQPQQPQQQQQRPATSAVRQHSNGLGSLLLKAAVGTAVKVGVSALTGQQVYNNSGGGGNVDFSSYSQSFGDGFWDPIQQAASDPIQ